MPATTTPIYRTAQQRAELQRQVTALLLENMPAKRIAYELGIGATYVSTIAQRAGLSRIFVTTAERAAIERSRQQATRA